MTKLNRIAPFIFAVLAVTAASIGPALAGTPVPAPVIGAGLPALAILAGAYWFVRMTKLNLVAFFAFAVLAIIAASIEPAAALIEAARALHLIEPAAVAPVPGPIIGAGLPALAILAGGYWFVRKFRERG